MTLGRKALADWRGREPALRHCAIVERANLAHRLAGAPPAATIRAPPCGPAMHVDDYPYLLVIDLEATCDDRGAVPKHEMETVEIGTVLVGRESLEVVGEFQTFVRPRRHPVLTEFCTKLTTIRQADVQDAPFFPEAIGRLTKFVGARRALFCCWGDYDASQLAQDADHHGIDVRLGSHLNLKREFSKAARATKKFGTRGALERVGLTFEGTAHRGIDDARNIARLLPWILGRREFPTTARASVVEAGASPRAGAAPRDPPSRTRHRPPRR